MNDLRSSFAAAYACLASWADLLDRINVFPVADGDTGTNLRISLAPLRSPGESLETTCSLLARCATGNSGNIAAAFFREFYRADHFQDLAEHAALGRDNAWQAIADPCPGTMLSVFDSLAASLTLHADPATLYLPLRRALEESVLTTTHLLPDLEKAGVVDAGALAMYVFFDGFFRHLCRYEGTTASILDIFAGRLTIAGDYHQDIDNCYCVDVVIQVNGQTAGINSGEKQASVKDNLARLGESLVVVQDQSFLKIHIHTPNPEKLRGQLGSYGHIVQWNDSAIMPKEGLPPRRNDRQALHIITDAAGSLPRSWAQDLGITLLDSYIVIGNESRPESLYAPEEIYPVMRQGMKITTAQASNFERQQHYKNLCRQYGPCLYLSVGAAFTGNYGAALAWKNDDPLGPLLTLVNTGAASGRLALIALLTARHAENCRQNEEIIDIANKLVASCDEFVFIHELKYLVAGGRVSKAGGFFGDMLQLRPIVTPTLAGVKKVGLVHSDKGQLQFALERLAKRFEPDSSPVILLQYSDNHPWVAGPVQEQIRALLPRAEILLAPLSLTSGVHMGPGTWSLAFAPPVVTSTCG